MRQDTFGNSKCAVNLAAMLTEADNQALSRRITNFIAKSNRLAKALQYIPGDKERKHLATMVTDDIRTYKFLEGTPLRVATHAKNVAVANVRRVIFDDSEDREYPFTVTDETSFDD